MSEDRLILAIGRLERALSRVEAVAGRPVQTPDGDGEAEEALRTLTARHETLKHKVESAIGALDRLIAKG